MALSATFTANFASFYAAVDKADAVLKDFGDGASRVGARLNALGNQFSGVKIIQEATIMAKAVEEIGGVSKLTEKELARLGTTANEAVEKMKLLGMDVPQHLQEIADKTKGATKATTDWMGSLTKVAGAVGIAFSIDAIKGFIGGVFDAAGAVQDLSNQWGVSTKAVQQWSAAAAASGIEAETLGKSILFFTDKLSEQSKEYAAQLKNVGLSAEKLRGMNVEDAYKAVADAIAGIKDETLQLDIAQGLLGPSAKKMIGGIRDGMFEAAEAQKFMSDETIKRLDAAGDAWLKFKNLVVIYSGEMLASVMDDTQRMTSSWENFFKYLAAAAQGPGAVAQLIEQDRALAKTNTTMRAVVTTTETYTVAGQKLGSGIKTNAELAEEARQKEEGLRKAQEARAKAMAETKRREDEYIQSLRNHNDSILDLVNTFEGRDLIGTANLYLEALKDSIPVSRMTREQQDQINQVMLNAIKVYDAAGEEAPQALYDMWYATLRLSSATVQYGTDLDAASAAFRKLTEIKFDPTKTGGNIDISKAPKATADWTDQLKLLSSEFQKLGTASGGTLGEFLGAVGQMIVLFEAADAATKQLGRDGKELGGSLGPLSVMFNKNATAAQQWGAAVQSAAAMASGAMDIWSASANKGSTAANALSGAVAGARAGASFGLYGAAAGAAAGAIVGFTRSLDDGREAIEQFANRQGGFDRLHQQLSELGAEGEAMWKSLTQGIKRGDLEGANREILRVQQALSDMAAKAQHDFEWAASQAEKAFKDAADAAKAAAQEELDVQEELRAAIKEYGFTIDELGPKWRQQELDIQATKLLRTYDLLVASGIDVAVVQGRMSDSILEYFHNAMRTGATIPETWRPLLESLAKAGKLTDEAGNKIEDLSGITFSKALGEQLDSIADKLQRIIDKILGIDRGFDTIKGFTGEKTIVPSVRSDVGQSGDAKPLESYQGGTDGYRNFGQGTPVMLHGWEAVVPRETSTGAFATVSAPVASTAAAGASSIVVNIHDPVVREPQDIDRLADAMARRLQARGL